MRAYNGAEIAFPKTIARLEAIFKVTVVPATDPKMRADIVVVQGSRTQRFQAPVSP